MNKLLPLMIFALALPTASAFAKSVGHYSVDVDISSFQNADIATYLAGWDCNTSSSVSFSEHLPDSQGVMQDIPRNYSSTWNSFNSNSNHSMQVEKNLAHTDEKLNVNVSQNCSKSYPVIRSHQVCYGTKKDGTPKDCHTEPYEDTETKYISMSWSCKFQNELPTAPGARSANICQPQNHDFGGMYDMERYLLPIMNQKQIRVLSKLDKVDETFVKNFCDAGSDTNKVVIQLSQGLAGHVGEDDYVLHVNIDGRQKFDIPVANGILDDEIAYCGAGESVRVALDGTEKDMFFNDDYVNPQGSVTLSRHAPGNEATVTLNRVSHPIPTIFGKKQSFVVVKVLDRSKPNPNAIRPSREFNAGNGADLEPSPAN